METGEKKRWHDYSSRVIVAGGREFNDLDLLTETLDANLPKDSIIFSGTARGADRLGEAYAKAHKIPVKYFPADWGNKGKAAGHIRNGEMGDKATHLIAFWDGKSKGTEGMLRYANKKNLNITLINY